MNKQIRTKNFDFDVMPDTFSIDEDSREFTCYGNVKNIIDSDGDRTLDGCFTRSIAEHKKNGTRPLMFFMHNKSGMPVGAWLDFTEDEKGLLLKGRLSTKGQGDELFELAKMDGINKFSIGMTVVAESYNQDDECWDIYEAIIREVSWVTFAANIESELVEIKNSLEGGDMPTKRELQKFLRSNGLSKRQAERITNKYEPDLDCDDEYLDIFDALAANLH